MRERYGDIGKETTYDDLDRDKDMFACAMYNFAGKSEAWLKVYIGKKHKASLWWNFCKMSPDDRDPNVHL